MSNDKSRRAAIKAAHEKNQIGYARHLCELYLKDHPDHVPTLIKYANNLISMGQYSTAEGALDHAQPLAPKERLHFVLAQRGHLLEAKGDFLGAEELFMQAHKLKQDDATYLIFAGSVAFRRGDIDRAQKLAGKATDCAEGCLDEAWFNLGGYLLSAKRYRDAADCYRKALEMEPNSELARERLEDVELILASDR